MPRSGATGGFGRWRFLGRMPYAAALDLQRRTAAERAAALRPDTLLLLEHPPTITLGRRAGPDDVREAPGALERRGIAVVRVRRGGAATYHGPGQLVGYPIVRLPRGGRGVRDFVAALEDVLRAAAAELGVAAERCPGHPGLWVGTAKLASIGIEVHRGVTQHGFALNVDMDLGPFRSIVPCGVPGLETVDLSRARGARVGLEAAVGAVVRAWRERFGELREEETDELQRTG